MLCSWKEKVKDKDFDSYAYGLILPLKRGVNGFFDNRLHLSTIKYIKKSLLKIKNHFQSR